MNIALWVVQILLAVAFAGAGFMKLSTPADQLAACRAISKCHAYPVDSERPSM